MPTQAQGAANPIGVTTPAVHNPAPVLPSESIPVGHSKLPSEMVGPGLPSSGPRFNHARAGFESPIEEVTPDGSTVVVGPAIDPGQ
jgi:hypothetical protein